MRHICPIRLAIHWLTPIEAPELKLGIDRALQIPGPNCSGAFCAWWVSMGVVKRRTEDDTLADGRIGRCGLVRGNPIPDYAEGKKGDPCAS